MKLPPAQPSALARSKQLQKFICKEIHNAGGLLDFAKYMQLALYTPELGYYSSDSIIFGPDGDFSTAPEMSPLFSHCVSKQCEQILSLFANPCIFEVGAGSGKMASIILKTLAQQNALPDKYFILELSSSLKQRQYAQIQKECPELLGRVEWLNSLPETPFEGVILANEVMDAIPVHLFSTLEGEIDELFVTEDQNSLKFQGSAAVNSKLTENIQNLDINRSSPYQSEMNLMLDGWINSLNDCLSKGLILLIDYGFPEHEYYHPARNTGTLMCHYRHHAHPNPLILPGLQDITAHINFSQVAKIAVESGLRVAGYTTQAYFLFGCGLMDLLSDCSNAENIQAVKMLTLDSEMGELFKVIALTRNIETPLCGFSFKDLREKL